MVISMMKAIKYVIKSILIGVSVVLAINFIGQWFNFHVPFNFMSVILIGFFHLPGFIVLLVVLIL